MGGRIDDLAVLESNPAVFYVGAATGGLWRTTNNGTTWEVLFDDLDDANLRFSTDFRRIYAALIVHAWSQDPRPVVGDFAPLELFR